MRILVVEDEVRIRKGLAKLIENHTEHTVVGEASNGKEGIEMALLYVPDVIITDIRMPEMDGLEMLRQLRQREEKWHFVILSGYSEFEYAQKAIQYDVDDYLIKPLAPDDVMQLLDHIQKKLYKEKYTKQEKPEQLLRNYLVEKEDIQMEHMREICGFPAEKNLRMICAYVGNLSKEERGHCADRIRNFREKFPEQKIYYFFTESTREFIVLSEETGWDFLKKELEEKLLRRKKKDKSWVWTTAVIPDLDQLRQTYEELRNMYEYALVMECGHILDRKTIEEYKPSGQISSQKYKKNIQSSFYKKDKQQFQKETGQFLQEISCADVLPHQIKEEYVHMAYFLLDLAKENDKGIYEQIHNLNVIHNIGNTVTNYEMTQMFSAMIQIFVSHMDEKQNISNYVILRAIDYIRNHYQNGISLDEVAGSLDITPEYLSTLFNREMGENFTSFLKKFRISHAKRLLKETDKKIYEIASEVGYADAKYFNRVFKEVEGISPGDYRALHA